LRPVYAHAAKHDRQLRLQQRNAGGVRFDAHAPPEYRANTVRNLDAWYGAFDVKPGEKLYLSPEQRVRIW